MIESVPLASLRASPLNPRKRFDDESIDELAESIKTEGLLQNLVVRPSPDSPGIYEIAAGERRLRAMLRLDNRGAWPRDRLVPVVVRDLTDLQLLQLATTENLARQDMSPMEEARAFERMLELGSDVETIAAETGLSLATVKKRLVLVERLIQPAIQMLEAGEINLGQAQALTAASDETQARILNSRNYNGEFYMDAGDIRRSIRNVAIPVSRANFPLTQYTGTFTEPSIFDPDAEATFDDTDQFHRLQEAWKDKLVEGYKKSWAWVDVEEYYGSYRYDTPDRKEGLGPKDLGVVIEWNPRSGELKVHEGLKKRETETYGSSAKPAEKDPLALTTKHQDEIRRLHTQALQRAVLKADPYVTVALALVAVTSQYQWGILPLRAERRDYRADEVVAAREALAELHPNLTDSNGRMIGDHATLDLLKALVDEARGFDRTTLLTALRDVLAQHIGVGGQYGIGDRACGPYLLTQLDATLPTWRELGAGWLKLYPKARLERIHEEATGFLAGSTRKAMIAGILDHPKAGWLDQVPPELLVKEPAKPAGEDHHGIDGEDEAPDYLEEEQAVA